MGPWMDTMTDDEQRLWEGLQATFQRGSWDDYHRRWGKDTMNKTNREWAERAVKICLIDFDVVSPGIYTALEKLLDEFEEEVRESERDPELQTIAYRKAEPKRIR